MTTPSGATAVFDVVLERALTPVDPPTPGSIIALLTKISENTAPSPAGDIAGVLTAAAVGTGLRTPAPTSLADISTGVCLESGTPTVVGQGDLIAAGLFERDAVSGYPFFDQPLLAHIADALGTITSLLSDIKLATQQNQANTSMLLSSIGQFPTNGQFCRSWNSAGQVLNVDGNLCVMDLLRYGLFASVPVKPNVLFPDSVTDVIHVPLANQAMLSMQPDVGAPRGYQSRPVFPPDGVTNVPQESADLSVGLVKLNVKSDAMGVSQTIPMYMPSLANAEGLALNRIGSAASGDSTGQPSVRVYSA